MQFRFGQLVKQQPIRLDMKIAVADSFALQRVITVAWFKWLVIEKHKNNRPQLGHVLAAFIGPLHILLEGG